MADHIRFGGRVVQSHGARDRPQESGEPDERRVVRDDAYARHDLAITLRGGSFAGDKRQPSEQTQDRARGQQYFASVAFSSGT